MSISERTVEVMGTTAHVMVVDGPGSLVDLAVDRLAGLEARWSRFLPDSELTRLNERPGVPVVVSPTTFELVERAVEGRHITGGRFDPTLLDEVRAAGYDRSFELVTAGTARPTTGRVRPDSPRADRPVGTIHLDRVARTVTLGPGVALDPGGIGKGLAADLVVEELLAEGARGAMANVGGDLRADGTPPDEGGWIVAVTDPTAPGEVVDTLAIAAGAVASSWRTRRAWTAPDGSPRHHLIDPATGRPADRGLAGVTVVGGRGWQVEVLAKAAFVAGPVEGAAVLADHGVAGLLVADDGRRTPIGAWERFRA